MAQIGGGMRNSAIDSSDRTQLLQDDVQTRGRSCCTHKRLLCFFMALLLIVAGHVIAIYYIHLRCTPENNCVPLKVRNDFYFNELLNFLQRIFGIPAKLL